MRRTYKKLTLRQRVFDRDRGRCAACGLRTTKLARFRREDPAAFAKWEARMIRRGRFAHAIPSHRLTLWDADHIVGRADGGPDTLENLRTLCWWDHVRRTTVQQAARRAFV